MKLNIFIVVLVLFIGYFGEIEMAIDIFIRSNLVLLLTLAIFLDKDFYSITRIVSFFKASPKFLLLIFLTTKSIFIIKNDFYKIYETAKSRGFKQNFSLFTYQTYGYMLAMLTRKCYIRALSSSDSLKCRGYNGGELPLLPMPFTVGANDYIVFFIFLLFLWESLYVLFA